MVALRRSEFLKGALGMLALAVTSGCRIPHAVALAQRMLVQQSRNAITPPNAARSYNAWPVSCRLLNGDILVGYTSTVAHHTSTTGEAVLKRSTDNGVTWGSEVTIYDDPTLFVTVYGLGQASSGRLFATLWKDDPAVSGSGRALISYSDDNGATWSAPVDVTSTAGFTREGYGAGPVVEAPNGTLLVTVEGHNTGQSFGTDERSVVLRSTDNGATWGSPVIAGDPSTTGRPYYESKLLRINSRIWCFHRTGNTSGDIYSNYSDDNGATWSLPMAQFAMIAAPSAIRMQSGAIVIAGRKNTTGRAVVEVSVDNGTTWYESFLEDPGYDVVYATPVDLLDGRCLIAYGSEPTSGATCNLVYAIGQLVPQSLLPWSAYGSNITLINNLTANCASGGGAARGGIARSGSGHYQFEITLVEGDANGLIGVMTAAASLSSFPGAGAGGWAYYLNSGEKYIEGVGSAFSTAGSAGQTIGVTWDNGAIKVYRNGTLLGTLVSGLVDPVYPAWGPGSAGAVSRSANLNMGAAPFLYPVSGASAWDPAY